MGDKGYQGIQKLHANSKTPKKKPRGGKLTKVDKKSNRELAKVRVIGEHINRKLKVFKILSDRYRNRRKRFGLRFNLIAGLYNYELHLPKTESASQTFARGLLISRCTGCDKCVCFSGNSRLLKLTGRLGIISTL